MQIMQKRITAEVRHLGSIRLVDKYHITHVQNQTQYAKQSKS